MRSRSSWLHSIGGLLAERLDQLTLTVAHVKQRLRHSLKDLLSQFVAETVQETISTTVDHYSGQTSPYRNLDRRESAWSNEPPYSPWRQQVDPWGDGEEDYEEQTPLSKQHSKLATAVEIGCETVACLLKGWSLAISVPMALGVGILATVGSYLARPWLGAGLALAASGLQVYSLVQPPRPALAR